MTDPDNRHEESTVAVTTDTELDEDDTAADAEDATPVSDDEQVGEDADVETKDADAETEGADADGETEDAAARPSWRRRALIGVVALLMIGGFATSGYLGWQLWQDRQVTRAGQEAQAAAVQYAQILTSIDSGKVDENFNQVLDGATGEFKDMYSQSSTQLRQLLIDNKATAHGVVVESAIQSESKNKVVVLLFVDQSVSNTAVPDPRIDRSRVKMTMELVDGRWRASKVELP